LKKYLRLYISYRIERMSEEDLKQEPICTICSYQYTPQVRRKIMCKYCKKETCSKCIEQYLLSRAEDAHCLHCRANYNYAMLTEICTKTYLQNKYFKHRQELLISSERANLPALQEEAIKRKKVNEINTKIYITNKDIKRLREERQLLLDVLYKAVNKRALINRALEDATEINSEITKLEASESEYMEKIMNCLTIRREFQERINRIENGTDEKEDVEDQAPHDPHDPQQQDPNEAKEAKESKEDTMRKKFIRRCTNNGCQGFLSSAWKCGLCEFYSCPKCFMVKSANYSAPHECSKDDIETAKLLKEDSKPCPKCGEFIMKNGGCDMMFCTSCHSPFSWRTGKLITSGAIHNPHYFEWLQRTGNTLPRNPADIPCGGFPHEHDLVECIRGKTAITTQRSFMEFHRTCTHLYHTVTDRNYRYHIDNRTDDINIDFLLGAYSEKQWGRMLATNEKKRKRDTEVQEIFGAFYMIAIELMNRVINYRDENYTDFRHLPYIISDAYMRDLNDQINETIVFINKALRTNSMSYGYGIHYIHKRVHITGYLRMDVYTNNFSERDIDMGEKVPMNLPEHNEYLCKLHEEKLNHSARFPRAPFAANLAIDPRDPRANNYDDEDNDNDDEDEELQRAITISLTTVPIATRV
jgi:hypothetical protein